MDRRIRPQPSVDDLLSMSFDVAPLVQTPSLTANTTPTGDPNIPSFANFAAFPPIQPLPKAFDTPALPPPGTQFREANSAADSQSPSVGLSSIEQKTLVQKTPRTVETPQIADSDSLADFDDGASVRTGFSAGTVSRKGSRRYLSKSQKIASIQSIFSESQKIAYAGLCYVCAVEFKAHRFPKSKKMAELYEKWAKAFMAKVFIYLDVSDEEQHMIRQLAEHGIKPSDLATTLVDDAKKTAAMLQKQQREQQSRLQDALDRGLPPPEDDENLATEDGEEAEPSDIRYVVLSHLFIICISDGFYDSRSRMLLRIVAGYLRVPWADVIQLEKAIADQLRLAENSEDLKKDDSTVERRNKLEARRRWLYMGLASLAGGAVIGLTAGLAAPFIGAGIGAALSTVGISAGAGVTGALTSTTGIAIITSTGVLTGGGTGGFKMMKRTRGITEFEFLSLEEAQRRIAENKENRRKERRRRRRLEAEEAAEAKKKADAEATAAKQEQTPVSAVPSGSKSSFTPPPPKSEVGTPTPAWGSLTPKKSAPSTNTVLFAAEGDDELDSWGQSSGTPAKSTLAAGSGSDGVQSGSEVRTTDSPLPEITRSHLAEWGDQNPDEGNFNFDDTASTIADAPPSVAPQIITTAGRSTPAPGRETPVPGRETPVPGRDTPVPGPRANEEIKPPKQTNVLITVAGWLTFNEDDYTLPFSTLTPGVHGDQYTLVWESKDLKVLGSTLTIIVSEMASFLVQQGIQAFALPTLMAALTGPLWALKLSYLIDNPWGNGLSKAKKAGKVLADALLNQVQENRPVTLIGYSLGARVIFFCLRELAQKNAVGIVEEAYLFGCPVMATKDEWRQIASVVSTRIVNGYLNNDYVLGVLYRASSAVWKEVAGLRPVEGVPGVENIQLDDMMKGHLEYRMGMPRILQRVGFSIDADWFEDVEDEEERERQEFEELKRREREEKARKKKEEAETRKRERERSGGKARNEDGLSIDPRRTSMISDGTTAASAITGAASATAAWEAYRRGSATSGRSAGSLEDEELFMQLLAETQSVDEAQRLVELLQPKQLASTMPTLVVGSGSANNTNSTDPTVAAMAAAVVAAQNGGGSNAIAEAFMDTLAMRPSQSLGAGDRADRDGNDGEEDERRRTTSSSAEWSANFGQAFPSSSPSNLGSVDEWTFSTAPAPLASSVVKNSSGSYGGWADFSKPVEEYRDSGRDVRTWDSNPSWTAAPTPEPASWGRPSVPTPDVKLWPPTELKSDLARLNIADNDPKDWTTANDDALLEGKRTAILEREEKGAVEKRPVTIPAVKAVSLNTLDVDDPWR